MSKKPKSKTVYVCEYCQSDNVELKYWVNPNTRKIGGDCEEPVGYCNDCELYRVVRTAKLIATTKVVGFQVVSDDDNGNIHPDMDGSFCLYSLSQANAMIEKDDGKLWRLCAIWTGDVEEPTMMFKGDPRM